MEPSTRGGGGGTPALNKAMWNLFGKTGEFFFWQIGSVGWSFACFHALRHVIQLYCSVIVISERNIVIRYLLSGRWDELAHIAWCGCSRRDMPSATLFT